MVFLYAIISHTHTTPTIASTAFVYTSSHERVDTDTLFMLIAHFFIIYIIYYFVKSLLLHTLYSAP
jgi:hypothetical protein